MPRSSAPTSRRAIRRIHLLIFLYSFSIAVTAYIQSSYVELVAGKDSIESIFIVSNIAAIAAMILLPLLVLRVGKRKGFTLMAVVMLISAVALSLTVSPVVGVIAFVLFIISEWTVLLGFDVALEQYSSNAKTGRVRGSYLTIMNCGWVLAPIAMGVIGDRFGVPWVFAASAAVLLPMALLFPTMFKASDDRTFHHHGQLVTAVRNILEHDGLWKVTLVAFALQFFYAWMVIYAPLYLHESLGFSWGTIGWMFSIMLVPFVLTEFPAGYIADRWLGEKELLTLGFAVMAISSVYFGWAATSVIGITAALFFSRVGASIVESMRDTYFYKHVDSDDIAIISVFHMVWLLPYIIAPLIGTIMLKTIGYPDLFIVLGGILVVLVLPALYGLPDTK